MTKPSHIIDRAKSELDRNGWYQGDFHGPDGSHCILGAVITVESYDKDARHEAETFIAKAIMQYKGYQCYGITTVGRFNDAPGTTYQDITNVMELASKMADAEGI